MNIFEIYIRVTGALEDEWIKFEKNESKLTKAFGIFLKHYMIIKDMIASSETTLVNGKNVMTVDHENSKTFNKHHIDIVEISCRDKLIK